MDACKHIASCSDSSDKISNKLAVKLLGLNVSETLDSDLLADLLNYIFRSSINALIRDEHNNLFILFLTNVDSVCKLTKTKIQLLGVEVRVLPLVETFVITDVYPFISNEQLHNIFKFYGTVLEVHKLSVAPNSIWFSHVISSKCEMTFLLPDTQTELYVPECVHYTPFKFYVKKFCNACSTEGHSLLYCPDLDDFDMPFTLCKYEEESNVYGVKTTDSDAKHELVNKNTAAASSSIKTCSKEAASLPSSARACRNYCALGKMAKASSIPYAELRSTIRSIMRTVDLSSISAKKIRSLCAKKMKMSLACRRKEMDDIIMTYMEEGDSSDESESEETNRNEVGNTNSGASPIGPVQNTTSSSMPSATPIRRIAVATPPKKRILEEKRLAAQIFEAPAPAKVTTPSIPVPPKKRPIQMPVKTDLSPVRNEQQSLQEDELFARRLQAEEWNFRQRTVKKSLKSRTPAKQLDQNGQPKKKKSGAYSRNCRLSSSLTAVLKANQMSRYDVVKKIWHIVRTRGLFDPNNKQFAICDEELYRVFGRQRIRLFGMMKYLKHHIKDI